jgi:nicotinamide phosphoribosyltransferase
MNYNNENLLTMMDSYKYSHHLQTPPKTEFITSYGCARGADDPDYKIVIPFGMQMNLKKFFLTPITMEMVEEAKELLEAHGEPFNYEGWKRIVEEFDGKLPISIEALPEGLPVNIKTAMYQITNTAPGFGWLVSFVETVLLRDGGWYPSTVATNSWTIKQFMKEYHEKSGSVAGVDFKLHDFGCRGVNTNEGAQVGGLAHLVNFMGTDTVPALLAGRRYYSEPVAGFSIIASEHSTITPWGEENENDAHRNMVSLIQPGGMVASVCDSFDIYRTVRDIIGGELKEMIENSGGTFVVRPDSGDPTIVPIEVIEILMEKFGSTTNEKGYRTLPDCIRVIQGDGINKDSIKEILANLDKHKLTLDNLAFGMGGALLQGLNRDTLQFAMKANEIVVDGETQDVFKRPVGDTGKASLAGAQAVVFDTYNGVYENVRKEDLGDRENVLREVYRDGELLIDETFATIRERSNS